MSTGHSDTHMDMEDPRQETRKKRMSDEKYSCLCCCKI